MIRPTTHKSISIGPLFFVDQQFKKLELDRVFSPLKSKGINLCALLCAMIAYKITDNFSISKCAEWLNNPERLDYYHLKSFHQKTLYRALELLGEHFAAIMKSIQCYLFSHYKFEKTDLYLDWTTLVLWGLHCDLGEYGYSRDHRSDKLQVTIGLSELASPVNIPLGLTVLPGNTNDMTHFRSTFTQVSSQLNKPSLIVFDKGANSEENLDLIEACGHDYLTPMKHNLSIDKRIKTFWESNPECINPEEENPNKKIYGVKIPFKSHVDYIYYSPERELLDNAAHHKAAVKQLEEARLVEECIRHKKKLPKRYTTLKNKLLKFKCSIQTTLGDRSDEEILEELECGLRTGREGFFILKSSRNLTLKEALRIYREKDAVEKLFQSLKNEIEIKPVRVWTEKSVKGVLLIGFLAQLFVSLVRYQKPEVKKSATKFFLKSLENLTVTVMLGKDGIKKRILSNFEGLNSLILGVDSGGGTGGG